MSGLVMIAENDPWDIQLLRLYAAKMGLRVIQVFETQDVLPVARETQPDVIVLECELPGTLSSLDIVSQLSADPDTCSAAVLWFAACSEQAAGKHLGQTSGYLAKPATYQGFRQALADAGILHVS